MILPTSIITRLNCRVYTHAALAHHTLAHLVGFFLLVVSHELNSLIVRLSFSKNVFVRPQQFPECVPEVLDASFFH